jgi:hypothetical protein
MYTFIIYIKNWKRKINAEFPDLAYVSNNPQRHTRTMLISLPKE